MTFTPHPGFQTGFAQRGEFEALAGGANGPGKTLLLIILALREIEHPQYHGLILRRTFPRLQEIIDRCHEIYGQFGGEYSSHSPFNEYSSNPPLIVKNGRVIGRLTVNKYLAGAVDPNLLKMHFTY